MPIDIPAELLTASSGSAGGVVHSHNQHGPYVRARTAPVDPGSAAQLAVRAALAQCVTAWNSTLTQAERDTWERYALAVRLPSPLGRRTHAGGVAMYVRSNVPRLQTAEPTLPRVDVGSPLLNLPGFTPIVRLVLNVVDDTIHPFFDESDPWVTETGAAMLFSVSPAVATTVNFHKAPYRYSGPVLGNPSPPPTSPATIDIPFPAGIGERVFVRGRLTRADGRLSSPFYLPADTVPAVAPLPIKTRATLVFPDLHTDVTFDRLLQADALDPTNWIVRHSNRFWPTVSANVDRDTVRLVGTRGILRAGVSFVNYLPPPSDVVALLTGTPTLAFSRSLPFG